MACDITKGRGLGCKDQRTGIKYIDFAPFTTANVFAVSGQEVASLPAGLDEVFRYEVKGAGNTFVDTATTNIDTRTTNFKQVLNAVLQRAGKETEVELKALLFGRVIAFVHDYNGNVKLGGHETGLDGTMAEYSSETSGYKVTLEAEASTFAPFLSSSAKTALEALVSEEVINVG
jgi:hypothetical protein